jgi:hypothetical protein
MPLYVLALQAVRKLRPGDKPARQLTTPHLIHTKER